jgi:hypothetical protein
MNNCNCNWLQKFKILSNCNCNWLQPVFLGAENELPCPGVLYYKKNQVKQPKGQ